MNNKKENIYLDIDESSYDYGFSFTEEEEILNEAPVYTSMADEVEDLRNRLRALKIIFMPLLENLSRSPDKPMIKWPNRQPILEKQIKKLNDLTNV